MDADYLHKLSDAELEFYDKFCKEYYNANFTKNESEEFCDTTNLHNAAKKSVRKEIYDDNNRRNNDMFGSRRAVGQLMYLDNSTMESVIESQQYADLNHFEDSLAELSEPEKKVRKRRKKIADV